MEMLELGRDEIMNGIHTGDPKKDLEMINAVLGGNVAIKQDETQDTVQDDAQDTVQDNAEVDDSEPQDTPAVETQQEDDLDARYTEYQEQLKREEEKQKHDEYLLELKKREEELNKEKKAREELEKKLQELAELQQQKQSTISNGIDEDEEEEFVSDYAKRTRKKIEELEQKIGSDSPLLQEFRDQVEYTRKEMDQFKSEYNVIIEERKRKVKEEEEREAREKAYKNIRELQDRYEDLRTERDVKDLAEEYWKFRDNLASTIKAKSAYELEKAVKDYFNGGTTKALADKNSVVAPTEYYKYQEILDLHDLKNGQQYDPVTNSYKPVLNDEGQKVTYRSLEEVYRNKNFDKIIESQRKKSSKEIANKLNQMSNAAVELPSDYISQHTPSGLTKEQKMQVLQWNLNQIKNDPNKLAIFKQVYTESGHTPPKFR